MKYMDTRKRVSCGLSVFRKIKGLFVTGWKRYKSLYQKSPWYKKIVQIILTFILLFIFYLFLVDINFLWKVSRTGKHQPSSAKHCIRDLQRRQQTDRKIFQRKPYTRQI